MNRDKKKEREKKMSWDERYTDVRAELRAAQRDADALLEGGDEGHAGDKKRMAIRKHLHELESVLRQLKEEAGKEGREDIKTDMLRRLETVADQRRAITDKLGQKKEGLFSGLKKAMGMEGGRRADEEAPMFDDHDDDALLLMQDDGIQEQNEKLSRLHKVIVRQKEVGQAIGQELDDQAVVIERLEEGVTSTTSAVRQENKRIKSLLDASSSDSRLTICICLLLVILIVVVILAMET
eukprot:TRINITY_DN8062_c1_g1_i1.p1 TRINITY_DN8062_c1_g1~~TRINITY_DN8062_c1_g1_i1.p1  ORF type:complete len:238 (+),score=63.43 TRINITY_DN8062_c1_g1_i1:397-1110(+)